MAEVFSAVRGETLSTTYINCSPQIVGHPKMKPQFNFGAVDVSFVVGEVAPGVAFLQVLRLSPVKCRSTNAA
jgi:hypothetical protein